MSQNLAIAFHNGTTIINLPGRMIVSFAEPSPKSIVIFFGPYEKEIIISTGTLTAGCGYGKHTIDIPSIGFTASTTVVKSCVLMAFEMVTFTLNVLLWK